VRYAGSLITLFTDRENIKTIIQETKKQLIEGDESKEALKN